MSFDEPYRVVGIKPCTAKILELWLQPLAALLDYVPGQYVILEDRRHEASPRSYSIADAPRPGAPGFTLACASAAAALGAAREHVRTEPFFV
jgi:NAD(P)H-flavin reductase